MPTHKPKTGWKFILGYVFFLIILLMISGEVALRILGTAPWNPVQQTFSVEPGGNLFQADSLLGFRGMQGKFRCSIGNECVFNVTHDKLGFRVNGPEDNTDSVSKPEIWIFGCSFTHGYGVDDSLTWPWIVQQYLPQYRVRNFAMTAYSTYQSKLLLESLAQQAHAPVKAVILAYGGFHNQRNTASRFWRKAIHGQQAASKIQYPYIRSQSDGTYFSQKTALNYEPWPFQSYLAWVHFLEIQSNHREESRLRSDQLTQLLVEEMNSISSNLLTCRFLLAAVQDDEATLQMLSSLPSIPSFSIAQDMEDPALRILPTDGHPNEKAHRAMAKQFLEEIKIHFKPSSQAVDLNKN